MIEPWQQQVVDERVALESNLHALLTFINSDEIKKLAIMDQALLKLQSDHMMSYMSVLDKRIARFSHVG